MGAPHQILWAGTFSHLDTFSYGIIFSLVGVKRHISGIIRVVLLLSGACTWVFAASVRDHDDVMIALVALGSVAILRAVIGLDWRNPILIRLGMVSYGLYAYHLVFLDTIKRIFFKPDVQIHVLGFATWWCLSLAATMGAALASYRWLESPFLRLKKRFTIVTSRPV